MVEITQLICALARFTSFLARTAAASERARVVLGHGHYRRGRDGAVSYEPKLVGNTTAKDKWRGLMKWTDGRRTRWPGFPDAGESSGSLAPPVRARACGLSIENLVKKKERHDIWAPWRLQSTRIKARPCLFPSTRHQSFNQYKHKELSKKSLKSFQRRRALQISIIIRPIPHWDPHCHQSRPIRCLQ